MGNKVIIIGAGLCGTLLALRLAQRGYRVDMYERRSDMRKKTISAGRSINLALSDRGLKGLSLAGIKDDILPLVIPMHGRMIHAVDGNENLVRYSGRDGEWINSVSRGGLNMVLLDKAEATGLVRVHFEVGCEGADLENGTVTLKELIGGRTYTASASAIFGTDGANSAIRNAMLADSARHRFDFSINYLPTAYKELEIPPGPEGAFRLEKNALHIWPGDGFMMIALPNLDGSFTVTLFLPHTGEISFEKLRTDSDITSFFLKYFPSATPHMPDLVNDFRANPTSALGTVKCYPWSVHGKFLLMGDAAHAVVPFYGQGMNASFEDVFVLDELIDKHRGDWPSIFAEYQQTRKQDADAIADLAVENELEMRSATADPVFLLKRKIELRLEQSHRDYFSKYSMVTFREDLPYSYAMKRGRAQDQVLMKYAATLQDFSEFDEAEVLRLIADIQI